MIKHIVFWRLNEHAYGNDKKTNSQILKEKLLAMQGNVDGLLKIEVGFDFSEEKILVMLCYTLSLQLKKLCINIKFIPITKK